MKPIQVGTYAVGQDYPPFFIGEIGINHNGSIEIAKKLVDMASKVGIQSVKFQKRDYLGTIVKKQLDMPYINDNSFGDTYGAHKKFLELSDETLIELAGHAEAKGLVFGCSAFDIKSYDFIESKIGPAYHKIASPQIVHHELLRHVASFGKPVFLSTGMCSLEEITAAVDIVRKINDKLVLFQCTSLYPVENGEVNLRVIAEYASRFDVLVGFSSHDKTVVFPSAAVALGACAIEKHITLDRTMKGPDHISSFEERGLELAYKYACSVREAMGSKDKVILERESPNRIKHLQSIVASRPIPTGKIIEEDDITYKSPGTGLLPYEKSRILGNKASRTYLTDDLIIDEDPGLRP